VRSQILFTKTIAIFCHQEAQEAQFSKAIFSLKKNLNLVRFAPFRGYIILEFALDHLSEKGRWKIYPRR
jgi:hypothetical protein